MYFKNDFNSIQKTQEGCEYIPRGEKTNELTLEMKPESAK